MGVEVAPADHAVAARSASDVYSDLSRNRIRIFLET
jgi:hypothetical protein